MSDVDATHVRHDVAAEVDEIIEHVINANMLSMPYDVYSELFDAVDGLGAKVEKTEAENVELRKLCADLRFCRRQDCLTCSHGRFCDMRFDERYAKLGIEAGE